MESSKIKAYIIRIWKHATDKVIDKELVDDAVGFGLRDFYGAWPWAFKEAHEELTTTASDKTVVLPKTFDGMVSIIEDTSSNGRKLIRMVADEFDRLIPDSEGMSTGTPKYYKVYYDQTTGNWKVDLYPTPSAAITLYLTCHTLANDNQEIPDKYIGGFVAGAAKYLALPGSADWNMAQAAFNGELDRLRLVDNVVVESVSRVTDSSDQPRLWDFSEYMRTGA